MKTQSKINHSEERVSPLTHEQKVAHAIEILTAKGVKRSTIAPPLFVLAWKLGLRVPPPLFLGYGALAAMAGIPFGVCWGAFMWFVLWRHEDMSAVHAVVVSAAAGIAFGIIMAALLRSNARKYRLPRGATSGRRTEFRLLSLNILRREEPTAQTRT